MTCRENYNWIKNLFCINENNNNYNNNNIIFGLSTRSTLLNKKAAAAAAEVKEEAINCRQAIAVNFLDYYSNKII